MFFSLLDDKGTSKHGIIEMAADRRATAFLEKPGPAGTTSRLACPCTYLLSPRATVGIKKRTGNGKGKGKGKGKKGERGKGKKGERKRRSGGGAGRTKAVLLVGLKGMFSPRKL
jgi:hypothetical protein